VSEGIQKVVGLTIFAALIVLGIVVSDTDGQTTTRNAAIPLLSMDGEEEPPPPTSKALSKLEEKVALLIEQFEELTQQQEGFAREMAGLGDEGEGQQDFGQLEEQIAALTEVVNGLVPTVSMLQETQEMLAFRDQEQAGGLTREQYDVFWQSALVTAGCILENGPYSQTTYEDDRWVCPPGTVLDGLNLTGAQLYGASMQGVSMVGANLYGSRLVETNFEESDLTGASFRSAHLQQVNFRNADLSNTDFGYEYPNGESANIDRLVVCGATNAGSDLDQIVRFLNYDC
jgi:hypothetical protein